MNNDKSITTSESGGFVFLCHRCVSRLFLLLVPPCIAVEMKESRKQGEEYGLEGRLLF